MRDIWCILGGYIRSLGSLGVWVWNGVTDFSLLMNLRYA